MQYEVREESFESLEGEWCALLPFSNANYVFTDPRWNRLWWRHFGPDWSGQLCLLSVRWGPRLVAVAPLMIQDKVLTLLGDDSLCDYRDLVLARGQEEPALEALLNHLASLSWRVFVFCSLVADSPTLLYLPLRARERSYRVWAGPVDVCPQAELGGSWEGFTAALGRKDRHELKRKLRRLSQGGGSEALATPPHRLSQDMEEFLGLMRCNQEKAEFLTPGREAFFKDLASLGQDGMVRLFFLEVAGRRVAATLCFDLGEELALYNSGYDPAYASLSAGLLLKALCIKEAVALGKKRFNFLRGAEAYKYHLGGKDQVLYSLVVTR